jgi:FixJ family two-component response regulator
MLALDGLALQARPREADRMLPVVFITGNAQIL